MFIEYYLLLPISVVGWTWNDLRVVTTDGHRDSETQKEREHDTLMFNCLKCTLNSWNEDMLSINNCK